MSWGCSDAANAESKVRCRYCTKKRNLAFELVKCGMISCTVCGAVPSTSASGASLEPTLWSTVLMETVRVILRFFSGRLESSSTLICKQHMPSPSC